MNSDANSRLAASLAFDGKVGAVRAVSQSRAGVLAKMGIVTVRDLLTHFPRRYVDMSDVCTIARAQIGSSCTIVGEVYEVKLKRPKPRLSLTEITLVDGTGTLLITCFRQPWLAERLQPGQRLAVSGKLEFNYGFKRMTNPFIAHVEDGGDAAGGLIVAVHPATEKLSAAWMRRLVANGLELVFGLEDPLPLDVRLRYRLMPRYASLRNIHFPETIDDAQAARRRLAYEEVLLLELHLMRAHAPAPGTGTAHVVDGPAVRGLADAFPFELTDGQCQARDQILERMAAETPANHMLLGDVGTGKTAVAAFALAAAADSGCQALMMAPTEVLANQYAQALGQVLERVQVRWGLLTGSTAPAARAQLLAQLASGELDVLFGTHALLEPDVVAPACSLVVIDEQQRFGVDQRAALEGKGAGPDVLSLTATPIPRSLALALYGNMTLSYLHARPHATAPTETKVLASSQRGEAYELALEALEQGRQVYVVCPLVGKVADKGAAGQAGPDEDDQDAIRVQIESEDDMLDDDPRAAMQEAQFLRTKIFGGFEVGVLHGQMAAAEKQQVMDDFRAGKIHVLVATTVIEVGVDVPNATVMIVQDADRFGLSQLHQLRGRVGRGEHPGLVCLISSTKAPHALERLAAMERTTDGFELAEYDLSLRREGDILGNRQHGASVLKLVNVVRDAPIIEAAHDDARAILDDDPQLELPEHRGLRYELSRTFEKLGDAATAQAKARGGRR